MNKYNIEAGNFVVCEVYNEKYIGEVRYVEDDCIYILNPYGYEEHFYMSDFEEDKYSCISVYISK